MNARAAVNAGLLRARAHAEGRSNEAAKQAYLDVLHVDPANLSALLELGALAFASGHRSAAASAWGMAARHHPDDPVAHVSLGNLLSEDGDLAGARRCFEAALATDPDCPAAHQGLARILTAMDDPDAGAHWERGFRGHSVVIQRYRGSGEGIKLLLLVAAVGGNIPTRPWIDDRVFAVTAIYADYFDTAQPLPRHALVVNAIGDADLCRAALDQADRIVAGCKGPVINPPERVRGTGRAAAMERFRGVPNVDVPEISTLPRSALLAADDLRFPLLLRSPGYHTGQHFVRVERQADLAAALDELPGDTLFAIGWLDARGPDWMARKYRVMFIDGVCYPVHLAISADWKVHYFTAAMAANVAHRREEQRFLDDMRGVLGKRAMDALSAIGDRMGLDYAGIDFGLGPDGSVLLFEANANMAIVPPDADPMWDYRRRAIMDVQTAARQMLLRRLRAPPREDRTGILEDCAAGSGSQIGRVMIC
jgi:hypothetical protein